MRAVGANAVGDAANSYGGNTVKDLADDLRELASPIERADKMDAAIGRAHRLSGLGYWRVFNVWYGKAKHVTDAERASVAEALERKRRTEHRNELHELRTRLLALESALAISDPDFHRPTLDYLRRR